MNREKDLRTEGMIWPDCRDEGYRIDSGGMGISITSLKSKKIKWIKQTTQGCQRRLNLAMKGIRSQLQIAELSQISPWNTEWEQGIVWTDEPEGGKGDDKERNIKSGEWCRVDRMRVPRKIGWEALIRSERCVNGEDNNDGSIPKAAWTIPTTRRKATGDKKIVRAEGRI